MRSRGALLPALLLSLVTSVVVTGPAQATQPPYAQIEGSGSTWANVMLQQWVARLDADGIKITYNGTGSSQGRKDFSQNITDFGVTELPYPGTDEFGAVDSPGTRAVGYAPIIGGGLAFTYQLKVDGMLVRDLRLSAETISRIFTNEITDWSDPAITADNKGSQLPSLPIIPVVRSDGAGTTAAFTAWMDDRFPTIWEPYLGRSGMTSYYPLQSGSKMIGASGSDQVITAISGPAGNGAIGYVDFSYVENARMPAVAISNPAGRWVTPVTHNVWTALSHATTNADGSVDLDPVFDAADPESYPLSYVAHAIVPTSATDQRMTSSKRQSLVDFLHYSICDGQAYANFFGSSPLPANVAQATFDQIGALGAADPDVDVSNRDVAHCGRTSLTEAPDYPTVIAAKPTISGLPKVGYTLTAHVRNAQPDVSYSYAWRADGRHIPGATRATYAPQVGDVGKVISVTVTPHRTDHTSVSASSDVTAPVVANPSTIRTPTPTVMKAPTTRSTGTGKVTVKAASGSRTVNGRSRATLTLKLGGKKTTQKITVTFKANVATFAIPKLSKKGSWKATIAFAKSDLIKKSVTSRTFTVRVTT